MYIRPTYGEVRLMTAEQKKIHMKNMQKLRDKKILSNMVLIISIRKITRKKKMLKID